MVTLVFKYNKIGDSNFPYAPQYKKSFFLNK